MPPELKAYGNLLNSHVVAYIILGFVGSTATSAQPVFSFTYNILLHVCPPSVDLYKPLCLLSLHSGPGAATYILLSFLGSITIFAMCSVLSSPTFIQLSPPSVDLYKPSPIDAVLRI